MAHESRRVRSAALLRELRQTAGETGYSLRQAADRLPCGKSALHALETGVMTTLSVELADRIAEVYGVKTPVLFAPAPSVKRGRPAKNRGPAAVAA